MNKKTIDQEIVEDKIVKESIEGKIEKLADIKDIKSLSKEELRRVVRRSQAAYGGRLHIDESLKTPGKRLRIDNDDAATRQYLESLGYRIKITDGNFKVGSGSLSEPSSMGSTVQVEQGISLSQPGILYEIDEDLYQARKEIEAEDNDANLHQKITDNQFAGQNKGFN
jgi:hypothetical protein